MNQIDNISGMGVLHKGSKLLGRTSGRTWCGSVAGAIGLNLLLFMLMPYLLHPSPAKPQFGELVPQVQVVRLKRPEQSIEHKTMSPPPPEKAARRPEPTAAIPSASRPTWPLEINTKLPQGAEPLTLPPVATDLSQLPGLSDDFSVSDLDQPLITLTRMPPVYPLVAKRRGIEGWVNVRFIVNEKGAVGEIDVIEAQPPGIFEESVIRCVAGWRFQPGTVQGHPVRVWAETTIRFELD